MLQSPSLKAPIDVLFVHVRVNEHVLLLLLRLELVNDLVVDECTAQSLFHVLRFSVSKHYKSLEVGFLLLWASSQQGHERFFPLADQPVVKLAQSNLTRGEIRPHVVVPKVVLLPNFPDLSVSAHCPLLAAEISPSVESDEGVARHAHVAGE